MQLDGKVAIITGAGSGIGLATVRCFREAGASVVAADLSPDRLAQFSSSDGIATAVADVSQRADVEQMVATAIDRFGRLDVLVNNAGIMDRFLTVTEVTDDLWNRVLAVNLTGPMMACRAAVPHMLQSGGGVIINIASVGGLLGGRAGAAYTASKHGVIGLTRNIAATFGRDGIRCVAVCPGAVETGIPLGGEPSSRGYEALNRTIASMPRSAKPTEIASVCLFLASADAAFINGAAIVADAGWTAV